MNSLKVSTHGLEMSFEQSKISYTQALALDSLVQAVPGNFLAVPAWSKSSESDLPFILVIDKANTFKQLDMNDHLVSLQDFYSGCQPIWPISTIVSNSLVD